MKVSYEWLKELIDIKNDAKEIADKITMSGLEVEKLINTGIGNADVVAVQIQEIDKHPDADKLFVTKVDAGKYGKKQIITNVKGLKTGDKVLAALEGVKLATGLEIKKTKLKGIDSEGMFAGWEELGIPQKSESLLFLDEKTANGTNYNDILPFNDYVIDIELTANRGDCLGMIGVAREIETLYDKKIKDIDIKYNVIDKKTVNLFNVEIKTDNCKRYCGGIILDVKIEPSPLWMQLKLIKAGIRPINNVVDITNYILMECNQPLHAFDMDKIKDHKLIIRDALNHEKLITLDDIERKLESGDIVIADSHTGHCLGGIMGGQISEVSGSTKNIFLEAAFFNPEMIRKTSKRTGLRSESSYRFERAIDIDNVDWALKRALYFFDKLGVGKVCEGIIDVYPKKRDKRIINITAGWINNKLGTNIEENLIVNILRKLGFNVDNNNGNIVIDVPGWRNDVSIKEDIAEEIARIYGYNNIKATHYPSCQAAIRTASQKKEKQLRDLMYRLGCDELMNFSFYGKSLFNKMKLPENHIFRDIIYLETPLTDDWAGMRNSLIPGMIRTASFNYNRQNNSLCLFEIGNANFKSNTDFPVEEKCLTVLIGGYKRYKDFTCTDNKYDYYDIKGIIDYIFDYFLIIPKFTESKEIYLHPYQQANIIINNKNIGILGKVHPSVCESFDLDCETYIAEIKLNDMFENTGNEIVYKEVPKFPSSTRDLALIVDDKINAKNIIDSINNADIDYLQDIKVFDLYKGKNIEDGKYSIAVELTFNKIHSTLTDEEIENSVEEILKSLKNECNAKIR